MPVKQQLIMFKVIVTHEVLRFARIWVQTIFPPLITTSLYFIIFGEIIGSQIGAVNDYRFIEYIVPGLILMTVITNAYANTVSSFYSEKFQRSIEEKLVAPVPDHVILAGFVAGGVLRGMLIGALVALVSMAFAPPTLVNLPLALTVMFLTAVVFSLGGFINGVFAKSFDDISLIPTFIIMPLTYLGGIFYSVNDLPEVWREVSLFNPIFYMVSAFRAGMLGVSDVSAPYALALIAVSIALLVALSMFLLRNGVGTRS